MRGFRASRAVQNNKSARFGRQDGQNQGPSQGGFTGNFGDNRQNLIRLKLPEWLRMPADQPKRPAIEREPRNNVIPIDRARTKAKKTKRVAVAAKKAASTAVVRKRTAA